MRVDAFHPYAGAVRRSTLAAADELPAPGAAARGVGDATFERLLAEGRQLRDEQIEALAFATEDSS